MTRTARKVHVGAKVDNALKKQIDALAKRQQRTRSWIVEWLLTEAVQRAEGARK